LHSAEPVAWFTRLSRTCRISPAFIPVLQQLEANGVHYFGKVPTRLEPIRELAGHFSRVLRVRVDLGHRVVTVFVKRYESRTGTPDEEERFRRYVTREHTRMLLAARCATPTAGVPRPIACFPDHFAIVTEKAAGVELDWLFKRLALLRTRSAEKTVERALGQVAEWLRNFQAGVPVVKTTGRDHRRYLDVRLQELAARQRRAFGEAERAEALAFFDTQSASLKPDDLTVVPVHGDLCPPNILVREDGVTVLDLAMSGDGTRYQDLTHLYFHLERAGRRLHFGRRIMGRLKTALLSGFDPALDPRDPLFRIMMLQHVACYLTQTEHRQSVPVSPMSEWRSRRRVAWCFEIAGVRTLGQDRRGGIDNRSSGPVDPHEALGKPVSPGCVPSGLK
jgi:aminoglycoside phosphotransferase (APT) family kinase protein